MELTLSVCSYVMFLFVEILICVFMQTQIWNYYIFLDVTFYYYENINFSPDKVHFFSGKSALTNIGNTISAFKNYIYIVYMACILLMIIYF